MNSAFDDTEKEMIPMVTVTADKNPEYNSNPGKDTTDQVFLLSIKEVNTYFTSDKARQCNPTEYAVANNAYTSSDNGNCWWWLRSSTSRNFAATGVSTDGSVFEWGHDVNSGRGAIRPALWINLDS